MQTREGAKISEATQITLPANADCCHGQSGHSLVGLTAVAGASSVFRCFFCSPDTLAAKIPHPTPTAANSTRFPIC
jgi:hypothetical protein